MSNIKYHYLIDTTMAIHYTNGDRILQAVLADPKLAELAGYTPTGDETVADTLDSENIIIRAVAMIIVSIRRNAPFTL